MSKMVTKPMHKKKMYHKQRKEKDTCNPHYIPQKYQHSPQQKCPILTLPLRMTTLISQNYSPFLSRVTKGKSVKQTSHQQSQHLHRASHELEQLYKSQQMLATSWNSSTSLDRCQLSRFNDRHFSDLNLGQTCMTSTLELETRFHEILNTSQIYPNTNKVRFVKGLANYIKQ